MDGTFGPKHDPRCNAVYDYANDCNCGLDLMRAENERLRAALIDIEGTWNRPRTPSAQWSYSASAFAKKALTANDDHSRST